MAYEQEFDLGLVTAYAYAVSKGYTGTEEEFAELMASYATVAEAAEAAAAAAAASATDAAGSASTATTKANNAAASANDAAGSATTASTKADEASASATSAAGNASVASTKAGEAAASATAAAGSATTASTKASEASTSATNAATAKTAAQAAQTAAETAQGKAEDAQEAAEAAAEQAEETLNSYAKVDGSYSSMTVGNAEQLVATVAVEDSVPYNFRTSGGTADIGDREVDKIVGGTVAWNQLAKLDTVSTQTSNGITFTKNADGSYTISGTATGRVSTPANVIDRFNAVNSHKYLIGLSSVVSPLRFRASAGISNPLPAESVVVNCTADTNMYFSFDSLTAITDTINIPKLWINIYDLTQMFGSTIADYIYSLETATPGAGVAWFRKLFPKPYYAYNPGELMSVQAAAHKMVGFNQFNPNASYVGNTNYRYVDVPIGKTNRLYMSFLDKDTSVDVSDVSIGFASEVATGGFSYRWVMQNGVIATSPAEHSNISSSTNILCGYVFVYPKTDNVWERLNRRYNICINLSWDGERDGEYEPYAEHTYPLDDTLTLRGIPKLDSGNGLYYDGDTYESDGTVTRRYGIVDLGTLSWYKSDGRFNTNSTLSNAVGVNSSTITCAAYTVDAGAATRAADKTICLTNGGYVYIYDPSFTGDAATFKAAMSGVMLVYELAEPTTETADPYQSPQIVDDFGTEEYVDAGVAAETRDVAIPVGHDTLYQANLRAKLEMAPDSPDGDGDYIVRQTNGTNAYVPLMKELPANPTTDGTYHLKATVTNGAVTLAWEADT